jgi:hypothetical protein
MSRAPPQQLSPRHDRLLPPITLFPERVVYSETSEIAMLVNFRSDLARNNCDLRNLLLVHGFALAPQL